MNWQVFSEAFAGSVAAAIITVLTFFIGWYMKLRTKRRAYFYRQMNKYNKYIVEIYTKNSEKENEIAAMDNSDPASLNKNLENDLSVHSIQQKIAYFWRTQVLSSEMIIIKNNPNVKTGYDKNTFESNICISKIKNLSIWPKSKSKINTEKTVKQINTLVNTLDSIESLKYDELSTVVAYITCLIQEVYLNLKGISLEESQDTIKSKKEVENIFRSYYMGN